MKRNKLISLIWFFAVVLEWINIVLFMAAKSYAINISIFLALSSWEYIDILFYVCATLDAILFGFFVVKYRKEKKAKELALSTICCLMQLILIMYNLSSRIWYLF